MRAVGIKCCEIMVAFNRKRCEHLAHRCITIACILIYDAH
jgi:hypothetical protein